MSATQYSRQYKWMLRTSIRRYARRQVTEPTSANASDFGVAIDNVHPNVNPGAKHCPLELQ